MTSAYGHKLDPYRRHREPLAIKGRRQTVVVTNNPSTIGPKQQLLVRFPNLGPHDVIIPGTARLAFNIEIESSDPDRTVVQNIGRALVSHLTVRLSSQEVFSLADANIYNIYTDLWKTPQERDNAVYQGIDTSPDMNISRLRLGAKGVDKTRTSDITVAKVYKNRYCIPLDFEMIETHSPFYQAALGDRLEVELTFNDASRIIRTTTEGSEGTYKLENICLEFETVTEPTLAKSVRDRYAGRMTILYDRILRHRRIPLKKEDTIWNLNLNTPSQSLRGILLIWTDPQNTEMSYDCSSETFYNPGLEKVEVVVEGEPNQLYSQGLRPYQLWDEVRKFFSGGRNRHPQVDIVAKDLGLADVSLAEYLTTKFALWLDFRTSEDNQLHGSGRRIENASEGITLQLTRGADGTGPLNCYIYLVQDAQLNIEAGRYIAAVY